MAKSEELPPLTVTGTRPTIMQFPSDLAESKRPYIRFACEPYEGSQPKKFIHFPCPPGISFGDGGSYTTIDLGLMAEGIKALTAEGGDAGDKVMALGKQALAEAEAIGTPGALILIGRKLGAENFATATEFANKSVRNPRTNTAFSGNTLRNFQFSFKLIGRTIAEVNTINDIQNTFREEVYAAKLGNGSSFMLKYPNQWTIQFIDPRDGKEMKYIPKIYTSYLTAASTVVNSTSNTFRKDDMSPYEIDISLSFQETKILTRDEIILLKDGNRTNAQDEAFESALDAAKEVAAAGVATFDKAKAKAQQAEEDVRKRTNNNSNRRR